MGKIQPFLVSMSTNAVLVMDFHCHLTASEVVGYLAGHWDVNAHSTCSRKLMAYKNYFVVNSDVVPIIVRDCVLWDVTLFDLADGHSRWKTVLASRWRQ